MNFYLLIMTISSIGIILLLIRLYFENKVIIAKEEAFNNGKTIIGINIKESISMPISQSLGFTLTKHVNGNKIIIGNGHSFLLEECIFQ